MAIHGFVLEEDTKPAHEHLMQAGQRACKPSFANAFRDYVTLGYCSKHAGIGKKLVAIFALHLDYFIVTTNFSFFYLNPDSCSRNISGDERILVHLPGLNTLTNNL